jgi:hypothetical protein
MVKQADLIDFIHPVLNQEIQTISGHYVLSRESRLPFNDREVLYFIGCAIVDSSCCGAGGCAYALVPGYIRQWKYKTNPEKRSITQVAPIRNKGEREKLRLLILEKERVQQVNFEG